jgi:hypothetical protein
VSGDGGQLVMESLLSSRGYQVVRTLIWVLAGWKFILGCNVSVWRLCARMKRSTNMQNGDV